MHRSHIEIVMHGVITPHTTSNTAYPYSSCISINVSSIEIIISLGKIIILTIAYNATDITIVTLITSVARNLIGIDIANITTIGDTTIFLKQTHNTATTSTKSTHRT